MNTSSFIAVAVIATLAFAAGWVMNEKYNSDKEKEPPNDDWEPNNSKEDNSHNPFIN